MAAEKRILRAKIQGRLLLSDSEKTTLAEIAHRLGRKSLADVAASAKPYPVPLVSRAHRQEDRSSAKPAVDLDEEIESLVVRISLIAHHSLTLKSIAIIRRVAATIVRLDVPGREIPITGR